MNIKNLNGLSLHFGFERWGVSQYGEPCYLKIEIKEDKPEVTKLIIYPDDIEVLNDFTPENLNRFSWNIGVQDIEGQFYISTIGKDDELLACILTEGDWDVSTVPATEGLKSLTNGELTLSKDVVKFLHSVFVNALNSAL